MPDQNFDAAVLALIGGTLNSFIVGGGAGAPVAEKTAAQAKVLMSLDNVENTSDASKPVSTAQQTALNLKANLASPALTGTPTAPTAAPGTNTTQIATTAFVTASGDVSAKIAGPASSTDNALVRFDLATGKLAQNSVAILTDTGGLSGLDEISVVPPDSSKSVLLHRNNTQGVSIGMQAGVDQTDAVCIGYQAGFGSTAAGQVSSVCVGRHAGFTASGSNSVCVGHAAGQYAISSASSVLIGYEAGRNSANLGTFNNFSSVIIGHRAGRQAYASQTSVLIGVDAGANVNAVTSTGIGSVVIGWGAASASTAHRDAVILGLNAGQNASASYSVLIGSLAGKNTTGIYNVMIGYAAGQDLTGGNKLVIDCNETYAPGGVNALIYGEFDNRLLRFGANTVKFQKDLILEDDQTPASASATGTTGMIRWDANYIYVCTAPNTWKRVAIATW